MKWVNAYDVSKLDYFSFLFHVQDYSGLLTLFAQFVLNSEKNISFEIERSYVIDTIKGSKYTCVILLPIT